MALIDIHDEGFPSGIIHTIREFPEDGRQVDICVPRDYAEGSKRYPVVYMNDGHTAFFPGGPANKSWRVAETLSDLYQERSISELIIVAVHFKEREREYLHAFPGGNVKQYSDFLANRLVPWINCNYRTITSRESTMILGSSHGGLAAFFVSCWRGDVFGIGVCMSPSFWSGLNPFEYLRKGNQKVIELCRDDLFNKERRPKLWIDWGKNWTGNNPGSLFMNLLVESQVETKSKQMVDMLKREFGYSEGFDLFTYEDPIGGHDEDAWAYRLRMILKQFFPLCVA